MADRIVREMMGELAKDENSAKEQCWTEIAEVEKSYPIGYYEILGYGLPNF